MIIEDTLDYLPPSLPPARKYPQTEKGRSKTLYN